MVDAACWPLANWCFKAHKCIQLIVMTSQMVNSHLPLSSEHNIYLKGLKNSTWGWYSIVDIWQTFLLVLSKVFFWNSPFCVCSATTKQKKIYWVSGCILYCKLLPLSWSNQSVEVPLWFPYPHLCSTTIGLTLQYTDWKHCNAFGTLKTTGNSVKN